MDRKEQMLKWLEKEKRKDQVDIDFSKKKIIQELKGLDKKELFLKEEKPKITLWTKLKTILWGN